MTNQQLLERAGAQIGTLAAGAGIRPIAMAIDLAGVGSEMLPSLLAHELAAGHAVMMRLMGKVDHFLGLIDGDRPAEEQDRGCRQAVQLSGAAARLTERYRLGLMSLARLERWADPARRPARAADPAEDVDDDPLDDGPGGGTRKSPAKMLAELAALERATQPDGAKPNGNGNGTHLQAPANRGRLRHGNPCGDILTAPRCGAKTRAGCACRQPAMANGRCRLHGGKSTGARTAAGLARCRAASLVHGQRTAEIIDLKSAAARHDRALHALTRAARANPPIRATHPMSSDDDRTQPARRRGDRQVARLTAPRSDACDPDMVRPSHGRPAPQSHKKHEDRRIPISSCPSWLRGAIRPRRAATG